MKVKASAVHVKNPDGNAKTYEDVEAIMHDNGLYLHLSDEHLVLVTWENVNSVEWTDVKTVQRVWAEAVLETLEDLLDDEDLDFLGDDDEEETKADDPTVDPYAKKE